MPKKKVASAETGEGGSVTVALFTLCLIIAIGFSIYSFGRSGGMDASTKVDVPSGVKVAYEVVDGNKVSVMVYSPQTKKAVEIYSRKYQTYSMPTVYRYNGNKLSVSGTDDKTGSFNLLLNLDGAIEPMPDSFIPQDGPGGGTFSEDFETVAYIDEEQLVVQSMATGESRTYDLSGILVPKNFQLYPVALGKSTAFLMLVNPGREMGDPPVYATLYSVNLTSSDVKPVSAVNQERFDTCSINARANVALCTDYGQRDEQRTPPVEVVLIDLNTNIKTSVISLDDMLVDPPSLSPNGRVISYRLLEVGEDGEPEFPGTLWVAPITSPADAQMVDDGVYYSLGWSPDSQYMLLDSSEKDRGIRLYRVNTKETYVLPVSERQGPVVLGIFE